MPNHLMEFFLYDKRGKNLFAVSSELIMATTLQQTDCLNEKTRLRQEKYGLYNVISDLFRSHSPNW